MIGELIFIGIISSLLGIFYRDCLKAPDLIFHPIYMILRSWVEKGSNTILDKFKAWIAYPLGYCIYCSTAWISILVYMVYIMSYELLPSWHWIVIGVITVLGTQHIIIPISMKYLIPKHPDMDIKDPVSPIKSKIGYK